MSKSNIKLLLDKVNHLGLDGFVKEYNLFICRHPVYPICILNYIRFNKRCLVTNLCRGLIITTEAPYKVVSRGFDRFYPSNKQQLSQSVTRATVKEDGSLIFMFNYHGKWLLSTMHNFADDLLPYSQTLQYNKLFIQLVGGDLNKFGQDMFEQFKYDGIHQPMTFCFEMCSPLNRVIRLYSPKIFLLAIFGGEDGTNEIEIPSSIQFNESIAPYVCGLTQIDQVCTVADAYEKVSEMCQEEDTFEGLVVQTSDGTRLKIKNSHYLVYHRLKYRGWQAATLSLLGPLIINQEVEQIIEGIKDILHFDQLTIKEILLRVTAAKTWMREQFSNISVIKGKLESLSRKEAYEFIQQHYQDLHKRYQKFLLQNYTVQDKDFVYKWNQYLLELFQLLAKGHSDLPVKNRDLCLDNHPPHCCQMDSLPTETVEENDGLATGLNLCYCGQPMIVMRLKRDLLRYRTCYCGKRYGILCYGSGTLLAVCLDLNCQCTHEVNQITQKPLGIAASMRCKALRLIIHELMDKVIQAGKSDRKQLYKQIGEMLGQQDAHMAKMGMKDCYMVIDNLWKIFF